MSHKEIKKEKALVRRVGFETLSINLHKREMMLEENDNFYK
jgi:hypothetical protein